MNKAQRNQFSPACSLQRELMLGLARSCGCDPAIDELCCDRGLVSAAAAAAAGATAAVPAPTPLTAAAAAAVPTATATLFADAPADTADAVAAINMSAWAYAFHKLQHLSMKKFANL